jgi:hypothetical protein
MGLPPIQNGNGAHLLEEHQYFAAAVLVFMFLGDFPKRQLNQNANQTPIKKERLSGAAKHFPKKKKRTQIKKDRERKRLSRRMSSTGLNPGLDTASNR